MGFLPSEDLGGGSGHGGRPQLAKGVVETERKGRRGGLREGRKKKGYGEDERGNRWRRCSREE